VAFPSTPILDNFNRADGALGANWTAPPQATDSTPEIFSNVVTGVGSLNNSAYWNAATFGATEAFLTIPTSVVGGARFSPYARIQNPNSATVFAAYIAEFRMDLSTIDVFRIYNNTYSSTLGQISSAVSAGNKVGTKVTTVGPSIRIETWIDAGAGWVQKQSIYDVGAVASYPLLANDGYIGFRLYGGGLTDTTRSIDDFGGGYSTGDLLGIDLTRFPKTSMRKTVQPR